MTEESTVRSIKSRTQLDNKLSIALKVSNLVRVGWMSSGGHEFAEQVHKFVNVPGSSAVDKKEESVSDPDFSYKDVSQLSEATDDVYADGESAQDEDGDLRDYNRLVQQTK